MNILICAAQVPFARGGAEMLAEGLCEALKRAGHRAEIVSLPFQWLPHNELFKSALAWRLLDLTKANGIPVDRVIATKFPSYAAQHPHKVVWLVHQYRQAYDWYGTPLSEFTASPQDQKTRTQLMELDARTLGEAQARFAISKNVAARLKRFNALDATPLYPPPRLAGRFFAAEYGGYVLYVGRLDRAKRIDLLIRSLAKTKRGRVIVAGTGAEQEGLQRLAQAAGVGERVEFTGYVDDAQLLELYANARAVYYAPVDEDYGFATVEALMAARPVITTNDAGGVLEFIDAGDDGWVTAANENELATLYRAPMKLPRNAASGESAARARARYYVGAGGGSADTVSVRIRGARAEQAFRMLAHSGPRGRELAAKLDRRGTRIWLTPRVYGGFTLNFLNTIFIMPPPANATDWTFKAWVSLLGHEACHIEQRFWVDSVQQEIVAYATQVQVGNELGIDLSDLRREFAPLNPKLRADQERGHAALLTLSVNTPAAIVYRSLPLAQPARVRAILLGMREVVAMVLAAVKQLSVSSKQ